jgi:hypothetical protein
MRLEQVKYWGWSNPALSYFVGGIDNMSTVFIHMTEKQAVIGSDDIGTLKKNGETRCYDGFYKVFPITPRLLVGCIGDYSKCVSLVQELVACGETKPIQAADRAIKFCEPISGRKRPLLTIVGEQDGRLCVVILDGSKRMNGGSFIISDQESDWVDVPYKKQIIWPRPSCAFCTVMPGIPQANRWIDAHGATYSDPVKLAHDVIAIVGIEASKQGLQGWGTESRVWVLPLHGKAHIKGGI